MKKAMLFVLPCILLFSAITFAQADKPSQVKSSGSSPAATPAANRATPTEREQDGYSGPVRRVKTEVAKMSSKGGKFTEGARTLLENAVYDLKGAKTEYDYFPNAVTAVDVTGRETYKYNEKGDISEMTLLSTDGSLAKKETYSYDYDFFGNWTKMTTAVAIVEGGKVIYEPTEVTYRSISYYIDEATMKRMEEESKKNTVAANPPANNSASQPANNTVATNNNSSSVQPPASKTTSPVNPQPANNTQPNKPEPTPANNATAKNGTESKPDAANSTAANPAKSDSTEAANVPAVNTEQMVRSAPKMLRPVSSGVLNGKAQELPMPEYPPMAKQARISGTVTVEVVIDEMGKVVSARAVNGPGMLQPAAVAAAKRARFSPTMLSGQPVKAIGTINYNFSL
jgi:protein TonB